ncbi:hypothetical protein [Micromonospora rubida]|uniref:hypothetical protein n=1 Tax=Micromonospora rubida TaxID=2697657 RepID=UPI001378D709|nr:hypothetical protein [Micromonospora rubida]NBE81371.1 hypothetical protein [Micromonospora rubida]
MRDDLTFAERMHQGLRDVRWPEPAEIRARARRRSRRTAVAAATAVLAVTSFSAVAVGGRDGAVAPLTSWADWRMFQPEPEPEPSRQAEIPQEALLELTDVGVPSNVRLGDTGLRESVQVDPLLETCADGRGLSGQQTVSRYSRSQTLLQKDMPDQAWSSGAPVLTQDVYRLAPGASARFFIELDRVVTACADWTEVAPRQWGLGAVTVSVAHTWRAVERDFAGDEAVLLRHALSQPVDVATGKSLDVRFPSETRMVVRVGDLVTVIVPASGLGVDGPDAVRATGDAELLELGRRAARRLCVAANPSC